MIQIDWSKQPEGFPLWLEGLGTHRRHSGWYRRVGEVFEHENEGQFRSVREGQFFTIHEKPAQIAWTGEGLPPAGTVCEFRNKVGHCGDQWHAAEVMYLSSDTIVLRFGEKEHLRECAGYPDLYMFRPARTPEQIAAEVREKAIAAMCNVFMRSKEEGIRVMDCCARLYDADYRKFEIVEGE